MFWQEDDAPQTLRQAPDDVVDVAYRIACPVLPIDHAHALQQALYAALPWLADEPAAGVHSIHGAESGNGWQRPEPGPNRLLHLSSRARLTLRLPKQRLAAAQALTGITLDVAGYPVAVGQANMKRLSLLPTLFSRYVVTRPDQDEADFLRQTASALRALDVGVRKVLCGRSHGLGTPGGPLHTRSLLVADLTPEEAVRLQQVGIGPGRHLGCGLFIAHKGIAPVHETKD